MSPVNISLVLLAVGFGDSVTDVVERVLSARQQMVTGEVIYQVQRYPDDDPTDLEFRAVFDHSGGKHWLRADGARRDVKMKVSDKKVAIRSGDGRHLDRIVLKDDEVTYYSPDEFSDGSRVAVTTSRLESEIQKYRGMVVDPLVIGMTADSYGHLPACTIDELLDVSKMQDAAVEQGIGLTNVRYRNEWGNQVKLSISSQNSLVRAQVDADIGKEGLMSSVMEAQMREYPGDLWFPETVTITRTVAGKEVMRERIIVVKAQFNQEIDPNVFTLAALDVRPGTDVIAIAEKRQPDKIWDGEKIVPVKALAHAPAPEPARRTNLMFILAINLAILAILSAIIYARSRAKKTGS